MYFTLPIWTTSLQKPFSYKNNSKMPDESKQASNAKDKENQVEKTKHIEFT